MLNGRTSTCRELHDDPFEDAGRFCRAPANEPREMVVVSQSREGPMATRGRKRDGERPAGGTRHPAS